MSVAVNVCLLGPMNSGKTSSCKTLATECGKETFYLAMEPGVHNIVHPHGCSDGLHIKYVAPASPGLQKLEKKLTDLGKMGLDAIQKSDMRDRQYQQYLEVVSSCRNFVCDHCGQEFGDVESWGPDRALVFDGLTGLSKMAMHLVAGPKPNPSQPEWLSAQNAVLMLIDDLVHNTNCTFVLLSHIKRTVDEINGGTNISLETVGQKLAPKVPLPFDEVVFCQRKGSNVTWSTEERQTELKARLLPFSRDIRPSFQEIFNAYDKMHGDK